MTNNQLGPTGYGSIHAEIVDLLETARAASIRSVNAPDSNQAPTVLWHGVVSTISNGSV